MHSDRILLHLPRMRSNIIVIPVDISAGRSQEYVEDCPVCCHPIVLRLEFDRDGNAYLNATSE
ncbi:MAG: CPXCG motif-containing cysteine-rich protein [Planctomycetota bacterium]